MSSLSHHFIPYYLIVNRATSYGEMQNLSFLDKLGQRLSGRGVSKAFKRTSNQAAIGDIGCGYNAVVSKNYWRSFSSVHLFDLTLNQNVLSELHENVNFHEGDLLKTLVIFDSKLDFIVMNNILEHIDDSTRVLAYVREMLNEHGILYVNVPSWTGKYFLELAAFKFKLAPKEEMEDHKRYYSKRELWLELRKSGFLPSKIKVKRNKFGLNISALIEK